MKIVIETIPHAKQRYQTTGDWAVGNDADGAPVITIKVSSFARGGDSTPSNSWPMEALVGIHEAVEAVLCLRKSVYEADVNAFDIAFEKAREAVGDYPQIGEDAAWFTFRGRHIPAEAEPGDQDDAPYYKQHQLATAVERMMAAEMEVSWTEYEAANLALYDDE